ALLVATACARPAPPTASSSSSEAPVYKQQIVAAIFSQPAGLNEEVTNPTPSAGSEPGLAEVYTLLDGGLSYLDSSNVRHPWFADAIPSTENGRWQVEPDGSMTVTWRLQPGLTWQDGAPLTADDLRFSLAVYGDAQRGAVAQPGLKLVDNQY